MVAIFAGASIAVRERVRCAGKTTKPWSVKMGQGSAAQEKKKCIEKGHGWAGSFSFSNSFSFYVSFLFSL